MTEAVGLNPTVLNALYKLVQATILSVSSPPWTVKDNHFLFVSNLETAASRGKRLEPLAKCYTTPRIWKNTDSPWILGSLTIMFSSCWSNTINGSPTLYP